MGRSLLVGLALSSCSPLASLRPASGLMPGKTLEVGAGAVAVGPRPYVEESTLGAGQLWITARGSPLVTVSAIGAFDEDALAVGGALRLNVLRTDRFVGAVEGELGYAWSAVSLPLALRAFEQSWLYSAPRLGTWSDDWAIGVPLGVSVRVHDGLVVRGEAQVSWQDFVYYNRRLLFAAGAAYQF